MPVTSSAKKALRQSKTRREKNNKAKRELKTLLKEVTVLISENKKDDAKKLLPRVYKAIDKFTKKNLMKKNTASRTKSRIAKAIKKIK